MPVWYDRANKTPLGAALDLGLGSTGIQVLGDSTGNETTEWVHLVAVDLAARYPSLAVQHLIWDNTNQKMPAPTVLQSPGTARHIPFTATAYQTLTWPGTTITGDLAVEACIEPTSWASGGEQVIAAQFPSGSNRAWNFSLSGGGNLNFQWSAADGTTLETAASSSGWTVPTGKKWVKVELDVDNGSSQHTVKFYTSDDGSSWTQAGSTTTRSGTTSIFNSTAPYEIAGRAQTAGLFNGKLYEIRVRNGIADAPLAAPALPELWVPVAASPGAAGTPIVTFVNGSHPGANFAYLADSTRMAKMTPNYGQAMIVLSSSHNEASYHGAPLLNDITTYATAIGARLPHVPFAICTQNPRTSPADRITEQGMRAGEYVRFAKAKGWTLIDTYRAFQEDVRALSTLVNSDGFHPNADGEAIWANAAKIALGVARP